MYIYILSGTSTEAEGAGDSSDSSHNSRRKLSVAILKRYKEAHKDTFIFKK